MAFLDFNEPFCLYTHASNKGLGAVVAQKQDGRESLVCCANRTLMQSEKNYSTMKEVCLAIVWATKNLWHYLVGTPFEVLTGHHNLQWIKAMKGEDALLTRWKGDL